MSYEQSGAHNTDHFSVFRRIDVSCEFCLVHLWLLLMIVEMVCWRVLCRLARALQGLLAEIMTGTALDGTMQRLFAGAQQTFCKCVNVDYESARIEEFYELSMPVKGFPTLHASFENHVAVEELRAPNQCVSCARLNF